MKASMLFFVVALLVSCTGNKKYPVNNKNRSFLRYMQTTLNSRGIRSIYLNTGWTFNAKHYSDKEVDFYKLKDSIYQPQIGHNIQEVRSDKGEQKWISNVKFQFLDSLKSVQMPYCDSNYAMLGAPIFINKDSSLIITFINTYFFCEQKDNYTLPIVYQYQPKDDLWEAIDTFTIPVINQPPLFN